MAAWMAMAWSLGTALAADEPTEEAEPPEAPTVAESPPAQPGPPAATEAEVQALRERLREMERQVDAVTAAANASQSSTKEIPLDLETRVHGYASVNMSIDHPEPLGFTLGDLVFTYSANLDRRYSFYSELAFEPGETGVAVDIEVVELRMQFTPAFGLMAGRTHAPYSYWASVALHGPFRFTPTGNPQVIALEDEGGGWMPIHLAGLYAQGTVNPGFWQLSYVVGVTNGRSPILGGIAQSGDWSWSKAVTGRLWLQSPGGLLLGLTGYHDMVDPGVLADGPVFEDGEDLSESALDGVIREDIVGLNVVWQGSRVEFSSEAYLIQHQARGDDPVTNFGGYALLGYGINRATPYLMLDTMFVQGDDPLYSRAGEVASKKKASLGLRYDLGLRLAVKAQADAFIHTTYDVATSTEEVAQAGGGRIQLDAGF